MALAQVATTGQLTMATVSAVATGTITNVQFWNPNTSVYQSSAPPLNMGQQTGIGMTFNNTSGVSETVAAQVIVTKPDGTTTEYSLVTTSSVVMSAWAIGAAPAPASGQALAAAASLAITTPFLTLDQVGSWKVQINLWATL